jgi:hypothetical protein
VLPSLSLANVWRLWRALHNRHYHATVLYEESIPDLYAAERLGHDVMVLKRIYQRLQLKKKTSLDEKVKEIFKKPE